MKRSAIQTTAAVAAILVATLLANLNRTPAEDLKVTRGRINAVIAGEHLRLDVEGARAMIGCYMRIEGLDPALVMSDGGLEDVKTARAAGDEAMRRLEETFDEEHPLDRVLIEERPGGFQAVFLYWDTERAAAPVLRLTIDMSVAGELRAMRAIQVDPLAPRPGAGAEPGAAIEHLPSSVPVCESAWSSRVVAACAFTRSCTEPTPASLKSTTS
jgi:hypothetical protein